MMEQNKKSLKTRLIVLAIMSAVFIPFSIAWYDALDSHCYQKFSESVNIKSLISEQNNICDDKYDFHWALFYGINGVVFGLPAIVFVLIVKKNGKR